MKRIILLITSMFSLHLLHARQIKVSFVPVIEKMKLQLNHDYEVSGNKIIIETLRFYVSQIQLLKNSETVFSEKKSFHLIDVGVSGSEMITLDVPDECQYNSLKFNLGIDSLTNSAGAMGDDLDPTKEMYWTWQSGYINVKLEGTATIKSEDKAFQYHVGGFQFPNNATRQVVLNVKQADELIVALKLDNMVSSSELKLHRSVMSPGEPAMHFADVMAKSFYIKK